MTDARLEAAYRATTYQLTIGGQQVAVRIGQSAPEVSTQLSKIGMRRWAFITAWNPNSELKDTRENARSNAQMLLGLAAYRYAPAIALPDDAEWPREPGFVVFDMGLAELLALATRYKQCAVVVAEGGDAPELVWIGQD